MKTIYTRDPAQFKEGGQYGPESAENLPTSASQAGLGLEPSSPNFLSSVLSWHRTALLS